MEDTAGALLRRLDVLGIETCRLVGYSMGGRLALYLALEFPDRFGSVVLESASPGLDAARAIERRVDDERLACRLEELGGDVEAFRDFLEQWYGVVDTIQHAD